MSPPTFDNFLLQGDVPLLIGATFLLSVALLYLLRGRSSRRGPPGLPLVGNLFDLPSHEQWETIASWSKIYGDVVHLRVFHSSLVFINSAKAATDLLDKRSSIYSDRPRLMMAGDLCGMDKLVPLTPYSHRFKLERRLMGQALSPRAVKKWEPLITQQNNILLESLLSRPDAFVAHFRRMAGSLIFATLYGHEVVSEEDPYLRLAEDFMHISTYAISGGWAVDFLPFLRWIPGVSRPASEWKAKTQEWVEAPYDSFVKSNSDSARNSFCGKLLYDEDGQLSESVDKDLIKWLALSLYGAGSDTSVAVLTQFILAMALYPSAQEKAQREIDEVIGQERLPVFEDRVSLPFVECVLKETLRWGTPVPLTVPHRLTQPDEYEGQILPEGAMCIANMWAILHDETVYRDPHNFIPERWEGLSESDQKQLDPSVHIFGYGRRRCPGIDFATPALWLNVVSILTSFKIAPQDVKSAGVLRPEFSSGSIRHPKPFKCSITARHKGIPALLGLAL